MERIVRLQRELLGVVCRPGVAAGAVTVDGVFSQVSAGGHEVWLRRFFVQERKGETPLDFLKAIAGATDAVKQRVLELADDHLRFELLFTGSAGKPAMRRLDALGAPAVATAVKGFCERFYDPSFYEGIPVPGGNEPVSHAAFMKACQDANEELRVCPLCDGHLDAEVDHFYPKAHYPALSCHPLNLVPICHTCNGRSHKGEETPLVFDGSAADPADGWFHPYLDSGYGRQLTVTFRDGGVTVTSAHPDVSRRLPNLDRLVHLDQRWSTEYRNLFKSAQVKLRGKRRRSPAGRPLTSTEVCADLQEWAEEARDAHGLDPYSILTAAYFDRAAQPGSDIHEELLAYNAV